MSSRKVHLVVDDPDVLEPLFAMLRNRGIKVSFSSGFDGFETDRHALQPDCLIVGCGPDRNSLSAALRRAHGVIADLPMVFVVKQGDISCAVLAMKAGAADVLPFPCDEDALAAAIEGAIRVGPASRSRSPASAEALERIGRLTRREREVIDSLAHGHCNKTTAHSLGISVRTVEVHRANAMKKLDVHNLPQLLYVAFLAGMMDAVWSDSSSLRKVLG